MESLNLHLTGDLHAVTAAHNLLAAMIDNHVHHNDDFFNVDRHSVTWRRVLDVNDRALRNIVIGMGVREDGVIRQSGFDITAASEVMAIVALSTSLRDMRERLGRIVIGSTTDGRPITAEELKTAGAMAAILKDAIKPNLMQTVENTPALVHTGPFGNIAHGNSSVVADLIGIRAADYLVTEAGFGADMGAERFFNIKCRTSGLRPDAAVVVATVRALKVHSGRHEVRAGRPLPEELLEEDPDAVHEGAANLRKQIENVRLHGVTPVVAVNAFPTDHDSEHRALREIAEEAGVREKIETIATKVYGADGVDYDLTASRQLDAYERNGFGRLPVCVAKTHLSISSDPTLKGAPTGWRLPVREVRAAVGAGFVYPICGDMRTMPGLPMRPAVHRIDLDEHGEVVGLA
jgi:formate--tetrahydrofolate ligase